MDMQKYLTSVLSEVGIPISFVARGESRLPILIYNITSERGNKFWDDEEQITKYGISINIFSNGNYVDIKNKTIEVMKKAGFIRTEVVECIYQEDVGIYNQPIFFDYYYEKENEENEVIEEEPKEVEVTKKENENEIEELKENDKECQEL